MVEFSYVDAAQQLAPSNPTRAAGESWNEPEFRVNA